MGGAGDSVLPWDPTGGGLGPSGGGGGLDGSPISSRSSTPSPTFTPPGHTPPAAGQGGGRFPGWCGSGGGETKVDAALATATSPRLPIASFAALSTSLPSSGGNHCAALAQRDIHQTHAAAGALSGSAAQNASAAANNPASSSGFPRSGSSSQLLPGTQSTPRLGLGGAAGGPAPPGGGPLTQQQSPPPPPGAQGAPPAPKRQIYESGDEDDDAVCTLSVFKKQRMHTLDQQSAQQREGRLGL